MKNDETAETCVTQGRTGIRAKY